MNSQRLILLAVAVLLVAAGAFLLLDDDKEPSAVPAGTTAPSPTSPPAGTRATAMDTPDEPPEPLAAARDGSVPPVDAIRPSGPKPELEPSPFDSPDSKELQYAVQLLTGPGTGPEQWLRAGEVFRLCIDANRFNHLCRRGLYGVWQRIDSDGGPATALNGEGTIDLEKLPLIRKDGLHGPTLRPPGG